VILEDALNKEGVKAVEKYRQSFTDNDRVATGSTNQSVSYDVSENNGVTTLSITGRKDINQLEEGVTASQYASSPATFSDLDEWINARGLNRTALSIDRGLRLSGWSQSGENRTGKNGGTKDIITTPTEQILKSVSDTVESISKDLVLDSIKI
jgi:hypothetical protein